MRFALFGLLTFCGFVVFALTMTFTPALPMWFNYAGRGGVLLVFGVLWWSARSSQRLANFRPVFFAYFTAVLGQSLGFFFADPILGLLGVTTRTPAGVALAKFSQASLIVIGVLAMARLCRESSTSLYLRAGRLRFGLGVGLAGGVACLGLAIQQPAVRALGTARLLSLTPWILLFVASNGFMEELLFRGLFLRRYETLVGKWPAIFSTALAFTLAHMQVSYAPDMVVFLVVLLGLSIAWGWLIQKTGSLWGSVVFHAGADLLIILPIFGSLGAV